MLFFKSKIQTRSLYPFYVLNKAKTSKWGDFNMELTSKEHKEKDLLFFIKSLKYLLTLWN